LSTKDIKEVIEKVWPCFFITLEQGLTRPLKDKIADLKGQLKCTSDSLDKLEDANKDLHVNNGQLIDLCKAKDKALHNNA
jgi:hypothetical protein